MTVEIYIDEEKKVLIVGKPSFEYDITHTELDTTTNIKKIWVKRISRTDELEKLLEDDDNE